jgi:hypothetical protein
VGSLIGPHAGTILIVTGILTAAAGLGVFAPGPLLKVLLGVKTSDAATMLMARHWFLLVGLVGGLLIYAGYYPQARAAAIFFAIVEKVALGALVLASPLRRRPATVFFASADAVMALLYVIILASAASSVAL